jgi:threonine dehydrogenase-like Zn-dependent dehydrogenase
MQAAFKQGTTIRLGEAPDPVMQANDIRVQVAACGVCGTDLHVWPGSESRESMFGHEIAGTVVEVGPAAGNVTVGQKVVLDSATPCGRCANCKNTRQELCTDIQSFFFRNSFGLAERVIAPGICAVPCADLTPDVACISEPLGVAIDMVRLADIRPDSNVLVLGPGPIGLMALALAKRMGARRVFLSAFARETPRIAVARQFGVDEVVDPQVTPLDQVKFGCDIDRILVTTPPPTLTDAMNVACKGGIISFIGIAWGESAYCRFDANAFHFKKLQLRASFASPALYTPLALQYLREGVIDGNALISHRFPLSQIEQAMQTARDVTRAVKVVVLP